VAVFLKLAEGLGNESKVGDDRRVLASVRKILWISKYDWTLSSGFSKRTQHRLPPSERRNSENEHFWISRITQVLCVYIYNGGDLLA
jgi:hypothetical protein